jgi:prephenate dehydrogenase
MLGQVTVIGCGLIGGSLIKALRARSAASRLCGVDATIVLDGARSYLDDCADTGSAKATTLVATSDLVVLAMPISAIIGNLGWVLGTIQSGAVVTDTGSVKEPIVLAARSSPNASSFVGGHPMAGREVGGFEASTADLFERARWFLVDEAAGQKESSHRRAFDRAALLAGSVGAEPTTIDAAMHDRAMAYVSHAPQLIASAVYSVAARAGVLGEAGPGFRDVTRISGAPASTWRDIFETNRKEIASALAEIIEPLAELRQLLEVGDRSAVDRAVSLLEGAQSAKRQFSVRPKEPSS